MFCKILYLYSLFIFIIKFSKLSKYSQKIKIYFSTVAYVLYLLTKFDINTQPIHGETKITNPVKG
jgi:hypothetical protein